MEHYFFFKKPHQRITSFKKSSRHNNKNEKLKRLGKGILYDHVKKRN